MLAPGLGPLATSLLVNDRAPLSLSDTLFRLLAIAVLIAINAFFVTAEFSIVYVRRSRISQLASAGDVQAKMVQSLQRSIERLLSTTQLGITLSSLALGWISENTLAHPIDELLQRSFPNAPEAIAHTVSIPLAFIGVAYLQIVLGELCPKSVALIDAERLARLLAPPSMAIARCFNPFIWVLNQSTRWLLRLLGIPYQLESLSSRLTPEELQLIISTSTESTGLEADERELLSNAIEFGDVTVGEVMVPRTSVVALPADADLYQVLNEVSANGYSRYPVMGESLDDISGILHFKDLAQPLVQGGLTFDSGIGAWIKPARFVSESMPLHELLQLMQRSGQPMVMVVDEFGGTAGLITIQDLTAEIIGGAIEMESEEDSPVRLLGDQTYLVQAQLDLEEVNELLDMSLPTADDYQTLGGFLIHHLQKIPSLGEVLQIGPWEMTVISMDGPRLHQVQIRQVEPSYKAKEASAEGASEWSYEDIDHGFESPHAFPNGTSDEVHLETSDRTRDEISDEASDAAQ
ncbi:MAG: hemolysin family protein [Elainellaceae cyanobacterium]